MSYFVFNESTRNRLRAWLDSQPSAERLEAPALFVERDVALASNNFLLPSIRIHVDSAFPASSCPSLRIFVSSVALPVVECPKCNATASPALNELGNYIVSAVLDVAAHHGANAQVAFSTNLLTQQAERLARAYRETAAAREAPAQQREDEHDSTEDRPRAPSLRGTHRAATATLP